VAHRLEQAEPDEQQPQRAPVQTVSVPFEEADDPVVDALEPRSYRSVLSLHRYAYRVQRHIPVGGRGGRAVR
jgi:hypothetical protein